MAEVHVEYDYAAKEPNELTITKGDIIKNVVQVQTGWYEGSLNNRRGLFPGNFVKVMDADASSKIVLRSKKDVSRIRQCRVIFSYKADHEDELNLNVGDIIDVLGEEEEGWWRGTLNDIDGVFPSNFVEEIPSGGDEEMTDTLAADTNGSTHTVIDTLRSDNGVVVTDSPFQHSNLHSVATGGSVNSPLETDNNTEKLATASKKASSSVVTAAKKLSPSGGGSASSLFSGLKKKIVDAVDGATGSKSVFSKVDNNNSSSNNNNNSSISNEPSDSVFDDVIRRPLLADVRATRAKAPGRRPPSLIFKDGDQVTVLNGNSEYLHHEPTTSVSLLANNTAQLNPPFDANSAAAEVKPKLREWEKHKAPWLAEMKLNQAKRQSLSPTFEQKLSLPSSPEKCVQVENETSPIALVPFSGKQPASLTTTTTTPESMSHSTPINVPQNRFRTSPSEMVVGVVKNRSSTPTTPTKLLSSPVQNNNNELLFNSSNDSSGDKFKLQPVSKPPISPKTFSTEDADRIEMRKERLGSTEGVFGEKHYLALLNRINKLEETVEKQHQMHLALIDDLRSKLQLETDMRMALQEKLEHV